MSEHDLIDSVETSCDLGDVMYRLRQFVESNRQFSVVFNPEGAATISGPKIGARNPAEPQPTPSLAQAAAA